MRLPQNGSTEQLHMKYLFNYPPNKLTQFVTKNGISFIYRVYTSQSKPTFKMHVIMYSNCLQHNKAGSIQNDSNAGEECRGFWLWKVGTPQMALSTLRGGFQALDVDLHSRQQFRLSLLWMQWGWFPRDAEPGSSLPLSSNTAPTESLSLHMSSPRAILPIFPCPWFGF